MKTIFLASAFFLLLFGTTAFAIPKPKDVVAVVNGKKITFEVFDKKYKENRLFVSDKVVTREKVLEDLINRELGIQRAKKQNLNNEPLVKEKMEDVLYHAQISKDLEPLLKKIVVTDKDVKNYYDQYPEYRTAHILFRVRANPDKEEYTEAQKMSFKVYNTLKKDPEKLFELANQFSQSNLAPNGGDMGFQPAARLAPEYFKAIKGKSKDFITTPTRTQFGYHVIKVLGVKAFSDIDMPLYKKIVYDRKRDKILMSYFEDLRKSASIKIEKKHLE